LCFQFKLHWAHVAQMRMPPGVVVESLEVDADMPASSRKIARTRTNGCIAIRATMTPMDAGRAGSGRAYAAGSGGVADVACGATLAEVVGDRVDSLQPEASQPTKRNAPRMNGEKRFSGHCKGIRGGLSTVSSTPEIHQNTHGQTTHGQNTHGECVPRTLRTSGREKL
jgi:hypothetical protein